jgi:hypothetical protein
VFMVLRELLSARMTDPARASLNCCSLPQSGSGGRAVGEKGWLFWGGTYPIIFSSRVPRVISRYTLTTRRWPRRWALSIAWASRDGFQSCSTKMTVSAAVRFRPKPPTCVVSRSYT